MIPKTEELINFHLPRFEEFPAFELYIDQVLAFLTERLSIFNRGDEPLITQAMINNYVKNGVLHSPVKKKYNREHIAKLVVICVSKRMLPLSYISESITLMSRFFEISEGYDIFCDEVEYELKSTVAPDSFPVRTISDAESNRVAAMRSLASAVAKTLVFDRFVEQRRRLSVIAEKLSKS